MKINSYNCPFKKRCANYNKECYHCIFSSQLLNYYVPKDSKKKIVRFLEK